MTVIAGEAMFCVRIPGRERSRVTGGDSMIVSCPPKLLIAGGELGEPEAWGVAIEATMRFLRAVSEKGAAGLPNGPERLHHADWKLTADPVVIESWGNMHPGCDECGAGVRTALRQLREHPDKPLFVGQLYWAGPA